MKTTIKNSLNRFFTTLIAAVLCITLISQSVLADEVGNVACSGQNVSNDQFFSPKLVYSGYVAGPDGCGTIDNQRFFSGVSCIFVVTLNTVFSKFYCLFQYGVQDILWAVLVLYIVIFGFKLLIGLQEATLGATILALVKMGIIITFTSQAYLGVGLIYDFFSYLMMETVHWAVAAINCNDITTIVSCVYNTSFTSVFDIIDKRVYAAIMGVPTDPNNPGSEKYLGLFSQNAELASFFIMLCAICPPIFYLAASLIWLTFKFFLNTLVSFLLCLVVVAFLVSLSPIFLCFMLFGSTYNVFDNWLKNILAYTIQPMLVFSIFSLWVIIAGDFRDFIGQIQRVVKIADNNTEKGSVVQKNEENLLICKLLYTTDPTSFTLPNPPNTLWPTLDIGGPRIKCCQVIDDPDWNGMGPPERVCDTSATAARGSDIVGIDNADLMTPQAMIRENLFIYFLAYHIISLLVISFAFVNLLKMAPKIAQELAQSKSTMPLGAGLGTGGGLGHLIGKFTENVQKKAGKKADDAVLTLEQKAKALIDRGAKPTAGGI